MISLEELAVIRERMKDTITIREGKPTVKVVVGMGTCGIAAGAKAVLNAFVEAVAAEGLVEKVLVTMSGCEGACENEPVVTVYENDTKVTYVNVTVDKVEKIVKEHLVGGNAVAEYVGSNR